MHAGGKVGCEVEGDIAVILIDNPPVNTLSPDVRRDMIAALAEARALPSCRAIVLMGVGRGFIAGADLDELDAGVEQPDLWDLTRALEQGRQPIVAAMHAFALGGGLAVALGCDVRIATTTCALGFPEVTLGLIPAFGATQYLTRLVGIEAALDLTTSGRRFDGEAAYRLGLVDGVVAPIDLRAEALTVARRLIVSGAPRQLVRARARSASPDRDLDIARAARASIDPSNLQAQAQIACTDAVAAAVAATIEEGVALESALFAALVRSPQSFELRRRFRAERGAR